MTAANFLKSGFNAYGFNSPGAISNVTLSASNSGIGWIFQANSTDAITHLGFRYGLRTGTPPTYSIRLESSDASGNPDNTDVGGGSATAATFTPPASTAWDGTWQWVALTNSYTPTLGQFLYSTIRYSSGTIDGSNNGSFGQSYASISSAADGRTFPAVNNLSGGTWTKSATNVPLFGYRTANGRYGQIALSEYQTATANTATHKSGMYFTLNSGFGSSFKLAGISGLMKMGAAGGSCKVGCWQTDGTELASVTIDGDFPGSVGGPNIYGEAYFTTQPTLNYGTKYYVGVECVSGTVAVNGISFTEAADRAWLPNGTNRGLMTYNGSFTETDTTVPLIDLILADITVPSGSTSYVIGG